MELTSQLIGQGEIKSLHRKYPSSLPNQYTKSKRDSKIILSKHTKGAYSGSDISSNAVINIHLKQPKPLKNLSQAPSIISSVLYLRRKSKNFNNTELSQYKGGGFKGIIKNKLAKSLLPTFRVEPVRHSPVKTKFMSKIVKRNRENHMMFSTVSSDNFRYQLSGRKLLEAKFFSYY